VEIIVWERIKTEIQIEKRETERRRLEKDGRRGEKQKRKVFHLLKPYRCI
ncbi:hypothetical protein LINGRAHAP2_LOCUS2566, partial [Linum grandiflorum]